MRRVFAQSSRKHRIAKGRAEYVIARTQADSERVGQDMILSWLGRDQRGIVLVIVGKITNDFRAGERILLIMYVMATALRRN